MNRRFLIYLSAIALAGCASETSRISGVPHSIATNPRMPGNDIEAFITPADWLGLRDLEYVRYVIMTASIKADGSVDVREVTESYPDSSWNQLAQSFGKEVILRAKATDSMLTKRGEIYVVFFKPGMRGNLVLIFGRQIDESPFPVGHRPKYLRTFVYY